MLWSYAKTGWDCKEEAYKYWLKFSCVCVSQWCCLPQGMANSQTFCQYCVCQPSVHQAYSSPCFTHYRDDIVPAHESLFILHQVLGKIDNILFEAVWCGSQKGAKHYTFLCIVSPYPTKACHAPPCSKTFCLTILTDFQTLFGNINLFCPVLKIAFKLYVKYITLKIN